MRLGTDGALLLQTTTGIMAHYFNSTLNSYSCAVLTNEACQCSASLVQCEIMHCVVLLRSLFMIYHSKVLVATCIHIGRPLGDSQIRCQFSEFTVNFHSVFIEVRSMMLHCFATNPT